MPTLAGKEVSRSGLGLMRYMTPGSIVPDEELFPILKEALANGMNYWNGADFYGVPDANSLHLINRYFTRYPEDADKVVISIKTGFANPATGTLDCSPAAIRKDAENALRILDGKKSLDLFGPCRVDRNVPIEETVKELDVLRNEGKIGGIQLSEMSADTVRRAASVTKIDMLEAEISLTSRDVFENGVAEGCAELGIVLVAHSPLDRGLLTGRYKSADVKPADKHLLQYPRFMPENLEKNIKLINELTLIADAKGCTLSQLALNWLKAQGRRQDMPAIIPIAGAGAAARVKDNAIELDLSQEDMDKIQKVLDNFPVAGNRFPAGVMKLNEY